MKMKCLFINIITSSYSLFSFFLLHTCCYVMVLVNVGNFYCLDFEVMNLNLKLIVHFS